MEADAERKRAEAEAARLGTELDKLKTENDKLAHTRKSQVSLFEGADRLCLGIGQCGADGSIGYPPRQIRQVSPLDFFTALVSPSLSGQKRLLQG